MQMKFYHEFPFSSHDKCRTDEQAFEREFSTLNLLAILQI